MKEKLTVIINKSELPVKEYRDQRVVTLKEIDAVHQRPDGTAGRNFGANREHFIEGVDFFQLSYDEARSTNFVERPNSQGLTLITESGYLMLVKSFTDDLAWGVQRQLVNTYFRAQGMATHTPQEPRSAMDMLRLQSAAMLELDDRMTDLEDKVENQMTIDHGQQRQLQKVVGERVYERAAEVFPPREVKANVGPFFKAIYRDLKDRFGVPSYRDIRPADLAAAVAYTENWIEPADLRREACKHEQ